MSGETEPIECIFIIIYYLELAHLIMEAEKSQDLQSASWWCRRTNDISPSSKASWLMTQEEPIFQLKLDGYEINVPAQTVCRRSPLIFAEGSAFLFLGLQKIKAHSHWEGKSAVLSQPIQMLISSRNTSTDKPRILFAQMCGYPVPQAS